jgi:hypothetical protein
MYTFIDSIYKNKISNIKYITNEFKKPMFDNIFFLNLDGLIYNSVFETFNRNAWEYNPQQFCLDKYGQFEYYKVVLLINSIGTILDFNSRKISAIMYPSESSILSLI